jgi:hypothetical protein
MAWQPSSQDLENLRFRLKFGSPRLIGDLLRDSADALVDFEHLPNENDPAPASDCVEAKAQLLAALADDRAAGGQFQRARKALPVYEEMVQRDLIAPLQEWAKNSPDPIIRNAGLQLASVCNLLHESSPLLASLQSSQFERAWRGDGELIPEKLLAQYLALIARFSNLVQDLRRWMTM